MNNFGLFWNTRHVLGLKKLFYRGDCIRPANRNKIFALLHFISIYGMAQNLVPNPGFEQYKNCPYSFSTNPNDFGPTGWSSATTGTPDYYNRCSIGENGVPHNWAGVSHSHSG